MMILFIGFYLLFEVLLIRNLPLMFLSFLKSIYLISYYKYKNCDFVQFATIYNFIFYKCGRSTELQKSVNETLYASSQISPIIFLGAECPIGIPVLILGSYKCTLVVRFPVSDVRFFLELVFYSNAMKLLVPLFLLCIYFHFFPPSQFDSLKFCIKQTRSYLKSQKSKLNLIWKFYLMQYF